MSVPFLPVGLVTGDVSVEDKARVTDETIGADSELEVVDHHGKGVFYFAHMRSDNPYLYISITIDDGRLSFRLSAHGLASQGHYSSITDAYVTLYDEYNDNYLLYVNRPFIFHKRFKVVIQNTTAGNIDLNECSVYYKVR